MLCEEPLIDRFFSIVGRMGIFLLLLDPGSDLTLNQLRVLFHLRYHEGRTMGDISDKLQVSHSTATGIVDRLVDRDLVVRVHDTVDRRRVVVAMSEGGREQVEAMRCAGAESFA